MSELPEYLKALVASSTPDSAVEALAGASTSIPRLSLRGRKFRFQHGSDDEITDGEETYVIIMDVVPSGKLMIKTFYDKPYNPTDTSPPTCSSSNGIRPDVWVDSPQSELCVVCDKNFFGSAISNSGKKAKACRDSKRLWVARPTDIEGVAYGLGVPVSSLKKLGEYGKAVKKSGVPLHAIITKMKMTDGDFPAIDFSVGGYLKEEVFHKVTDRIENKDWSTDDVELLVASSPIKKVEHRVTPQPHPEADVTPTKPKPISKSPEPTNDKEDDILAGWGD